MNSLPKFCLRDRWLALPFAAASLLLGPGLFAFQAAPTPAPRNLAQTLRASRGEKRLLLVAAATASQVDFRAQKALLTASEDQLAARDLLVLDVLYDQLPAADRQLLARRYGLRPPGFAAVLIGKDGGVKLRSARPLAPAALFAVVDAMPMRQAELRRRGR